MRDYEELEWIESDGNQYIDTTQQLYYGDSYEIEFEWMSSITKENKVVGAGIDLYKNCTFPRFGITGYCAAYINNKDFPLYPQYSINYFFSRRLKSRLELWNNGFISIADSFNNIIALIFISGINTDFKTGNTAFIFRDNSENYTFESNSRVYDFKLSNSEITKQHLLPCRRLSDNAIGMYDTISKRFFANQGSGSFIAGPATGRYY